MAGLGVVQAQKEHKGARSIPCIRRNAILMAGLGVQSSHIEFYSFGLS